MVLDGSKEKSVEFVAESTFDTFPTDPTMLGFGGYANPVSIKKTPVVNSFSYLKGMTQTDRLQSTQSQKVSEAFAANLELRPTAWTILPYFLRGATAATYAIGDTEHNISLGQKIDADYEKITGGCFKKFECIIEPDKEAVCNLEMLFAAVSGFTTTYIGAGAHAASPSGDVLTFGDLTGITYDASAFSVVKAHLESVKFGVDYPVRAVKDISGTNNSKIGGWAFGQRNISLELGVTLDDIDLAAQFLAGAAHGFVFTALAKTFTFSGIKWKGDWDQALDPDDVLGMTLQADFTNLVIS